jgi:hypothetical protein
MARLEIVNARRLINGPKAKWSIRAIKRGIFMKYLIYHRLMPSISSEAEAIQQQMPEGDSTVAQ